MREREKCADGSQDMASPEKVVRCEGNMWVDLQPELLVNIFQRLPLKELLSVIPCVCKPWMRASLDPFCWQVLDLRAGPAIPYGLAPLLLRRTEGHLREFVFPFMPRHPDWLQVLESSAPVLQKLHIPYGYVSDEWIIKVAPLMTSLTDVDVSNITNWPFSHVALEAIGNHCKRITQLRRNKKQYLSVYSSYLFRDDNEVFAIARSFPSLTHLELRDNCFSSQGVRAILDGCPMLEHLDLSTCVMDMDELLWRECRTRLRVFLEPRRLPEVDEYDDDDDGYDYDDVYNDGGDDDDDDDDDVFLEPGRLVEADEYDDEDDDENENVSCGCGGFPKMRKDCISKLDHFCELCDCPLYDCTIESEYEGESKDDEAEEAGDENEDEDGNGGAHAYQGEGDEDECDIENEEDYADDDGGGDVDVDEGEGEDNCEDGFEIGNENEEDYVDDDACGDAYIDESEDIYEDEEHYVDDAACGDAYIDANENICEDGCEIGDENEEDYVDDDDYAGGEADADEGGDEDVCEEECNFDDEIEEDYADDDFADDDYDQDGEDDVFFL